MKISPEQRVSRKDKLLSSNPLLSKLVNTYSQDNIQKRNLLPFYGKQLCNFVCIIHQRLKFSPGMGLKCYVMLCYVTYLGSLGICCSMY